MRGWVLILNLILSIVFLKNSYVKTPKKQLTIRVD